MQAKSPQRRMSVVVLAGDRTPEHELLKYTGVCCKAFIEINRVPLLLRVIGALDQAKLVDKILLSGPKREQLGIRPDISTLVDSGKISWHEPQPTPSSSAYQIMQTLPEDTAVLITTADLPFLDSDMVDSFCLRSLGQGVDVTVGLAP